MQPKLAPLVHEELSLAALGAHGTVRGTRLVSSGGVEGTVGDVMRAALEMAAVTFVMAHGHPSGDPRPSDTDFDLTNTIADAGHIMRIPLKHHVIVTPSGRCAEILE